MSSIDVHSAVRTIAEAIQPGNYSDKGLQKAVVLSLLELKPVQMFIRTKEGRQTLKVPFLKARSSEYRAREGEIDKEISNIFAKINPKLDPVCVADLDTFKLLIFYEHRKNDKIADICALLIDDTSLLDGYQQLGGSELKSVIFEQRQNLQILVRTITMAVRWRDSFYNNYGPDISKKFWEDAGGAKKDSLSILEVEDKPANTITLSLDMRKSTFTMQQAVDKNAYAKWIAEFVSTLTEITHKNFGVFDKFTGDGIISHFLCEDVEGLCSNGSENSINIGKQIFTQIDNKYICDKNLRENIFTSLLAIKCAWEMIIFVNSHMDKLYPNLNWKSKKLGPAIGIGFGPARWSNDASGNPIVVGPGVVDACRLTDGPPNVLQMTNYIAGLLIKSNADIVISETEFSSKEFSEDIGVTLCSMDVVPRGLGIRS